LEDIVNAIEKLAEKTWVDYALIGAPIILSIVAIGITIYVARKQNKIALFEKRYNCLYQLYTIGCFSKEIQNIGKESIKSNAPPNVINSNIILVLFGSHWGVDVIESPTIQKLTQTKCQIDLIRSYISQAQFLFNQKFSVDLNEIGRLFQNIVLGATQNKVLIEDIEKFCELCNKFYKIDYPKMKKQVFLKR